MQAYDLVAGTQGLTMSRFNGRKESHRQFPTLAQTRSEDGSSLKGTVSDPSLLCACSCTCMLYNEMLDAEHYCLVVQMHNHYHHSMTYGPTIADCIL